MNIDKLGNITFPKNSFFKKNKTVFQKIKLLNSAFTQATP